MRDEVLGFVTTRFGRIQLVIFRKKFFPELSEDTGVLLCDQYGNRRTWFAVAILRDIEEAERENYLEQPVDIEAVLSGRTRLTHYLLAQRARHLYERLSEDNHVVRLSAVADVGIGYVTG